MMTIMKKKKLLISELLFPVIILVSINLIGCGNSGDSAPTITSISPSVGFEGLTASSGSCTSVSPGAVTINGSNFGLTQGTSFVLVDNFNAGTASSWNDSTIVFNAPSQATPQPSDPGVYISPDGNFNKDQPVTVTVNYLVSNAVTYTYSVTCH